MKRILQTISHVSKKSLKKLALAIFYVFLFLQINTISFACINGGESSYKTDTFKVKDGTVLFSDSNFIDSKTPTGHSFNDAQEFIKGVENLDRLYLKTKDIEYLSDKGILLILLKKYDEAIQLYLNIEQKSPNRYATSANLGTAYELSGQNELALAWIKKAIKINPLSHHESEWIHVKILEAKIKGSQLINSRFLLNTDFGINTQPHTTLTNEQLKKLSQALYFQLNERMSFIKENDLIVAQLLFDLGNINFLLNDYYSASGNYLQAKEYGFTNQLLIEKRLAEIQRLINLKEAIQTEREKTFSYQFFSFIVAIFTSFIGISLIILAVLFYRAGSELDASHSYYFATIKKYAVFSGKTNRRTFWWFMCSHLLTLIYIALICNFLEIISESSGKFRYIPLIYIGLTLVPSIAITVRRLHDVGKSGWYFWVPAYNLFLLLKSANSSK
jgi:tetratricopeptide (TPR) repeat protein